MLRNYTFLIQLLIHDSMFHVLYSSSKFFSVFIPYFMHQLCTLSIKPGSQFFISFIIYSNTFDGILERRRNNSDSFGFFLSIFLLWSLIRTDMFHYYCH
jgi:hypothetical protein